MGTDTTGDTSPNSIVKNITETTRYRGRHAETDACCYLQLHGLELITKNYHCKGGEIDLIMRDQEYLVFVEVRMRLSSDFGNSLETITTTKQQRIIHAAQHYLQQENLFDKKWCRFDAIGIDTNWQFIWIKNAFEVQY